MLKVILRLCINILREYDNLNAISIAAIERPIIEKVEQESVTKWLADFFENLYKRLVFNGDTFFLKTLK